MDASERSNNNENGEWKWWERERVRDVSRVVLSFSIVNSILFRSIFNSILTHSLFGNNPRSLLTIMMMMKLILKYSFFFITFISLCFQLGTLIYSQSFPVGVYGQKDKFPLHPLIIKYFYPHHFFLVVCVTFSLHPDISVISLCILPYYNNIPWIPKLPTVL